jgi:hypothetical protein
MTDRVWCFFEHRGVRRHDPSTWPVGYGSNNQGLRRSGVFNRFANDLTCVVTSASQRVGTCTVSLATSTPVASQTGDNGVSVA